MPMYEYHCSKCDKNFEVLQKFSDGPLRKHAGCGGKVERVLSAPAFQFKGSGWYVTDYGKGGVKPSSGDSSEKKSSDSSSHTSSASDAKSADSKSESKTESKSESKSEAKSESKSESKSASKSASKSSTK